MSPNKFDKLKYKKEQNIGKSKFKEQGNNNLDFSRNIFIVYIVKQC